MSNTNPGTAHAVTPDDHSHLTVEDAGSTTDPADLVDDDASTGAGSTGTGGTGTNSAASGDDDSVAHVFDQTNGVVEGIDGDSDGTAASDEYSSAERGEGDGALDGSEPLGGDTIPPQRTDGSAL